MSPGQNLGERLIVGDNRGLFSWKDDLVNALTRDIGAFAARTAVKQSADLLRNLRPCGRREYRRQGAEQQTRNNTVHNYSFDQCILRGPSSVSPVRERLCRRPRHYFAAALACTRVPARSSSVPRLAIMSPCLRPPYTSTKFPTAGPRVTGTHCTTSSFTRMTKVCSV